MKAAAAPALVVALALAGCPHPSADNPSRVDADDAIVYLVVAVPDAALWIDGVFVGSVADVKRGFAIQAGRHRIELHHDAYFSHYEVLDLAPAQRLELPIELAPQLP